MRKAVFSIEEKHTDDRHGDVDWREIAEVVGSYEPRSASVQSEGKQEQEIEKVDVFINWQPGLFDGQIERRLVHEDGTIFTVESAVDLGAFHKTLKVMCTQQ